jgi:hypothetical protein
MFDLRNSVRRKDVLISSITGFSCVSTVVARIEKSMRARVALLQGGSLLRPS